MLQQLASSRTLRQLQSLNTTEDLLECTPEHEPSFPCLQDLVIHTCDISQCGSLLQRVSPNCLRSIELISHTNKSPLLPREVQTFFEALGNGRSLSSLTSIHISQSYWSRADSEIETRVITFDTIEPLLRFSSLEELVIRFQCVVQLDGHSIERMNLAWRQMRKFHFGNENTVVFGGRHVELAVPTLSYL